MIKRECGDCTLCCKLIPVQELEKKANTRCEHQRFRNGCAIYKDRPLSCKMFSCRWLTNQDTHDLARPDRVHYVIDQTLDFVTATSSEHDPIQIAAIQIWVDPNYPKAHRNPALRRYLLRQGESGAVGLVRFNSNDSVTLFPPTMMSDGQWHEIKGQQEDEHTPKQLLDMFGLGGFTG